MPNHVKHIMKVNGNDEEVKDFFESIKIKERLFDFNVFIPKPEHIKLPEGVDGISSFIKDAAELIMLRSGQVVLDYRGNRKNERQIINYGHQIQWEDQHFELFIRCCKAIQECSFSTWWDWCVYNWGTKWGAYSIIQKEINVMEFETAWNTPMPIWNKIAERYPSLSFTVLYADEDYGANCGIINISNGKVSQEFRETEDFAYSVWDLSKEEIAEMKAE